MAGKIILQRRSEFYNKLRGVKVMIDGIEKTPIKAGASEEYPVEPGTHIIQCQISSYKSTRLTLALNEGESKFLKVRMGMKYFGITYIILIIALLSDIIPRAAGFPKPEWWPWMKLAIIIPVVLYYLYYLTIGRKYYLIMEEDHDNIFK